MAQLFFNPTNSHEFYWLEAGNLRKVSVDNKTVSAVLITNIASLQLRHDRIMVVETGATPDQAEQILYSYNLDGGDKKQVVVLGADSEGYELDYVKGRFNDYAAARARSKNIFYLIRDPLSNNHTTSVLTKDIKAFTFSPTGRFLVVNRADQLKTYDLEFTQIYDYHYSLTGLTGWQWYNDYHLLVTVANQARLVDFDGQNSYSLQQSGAAVSNSVPLEPDKYIDYLTAAGQITRVDLLLKR